MRERIRREDGERERKKKEKEGERMETGSALAGRPCEAARERAWSPSVPPDPYKPGSGSSSVCFCWFQFGKKLILRLDRTPQRANPVGRSHGAYRLLGVTASKYESFACRMLAASKHPKLS